MKKNSTPKMNLENKIPKMYNEISWADGLRASIQPGFTFMDAEIKAGNKDYLTKYDKIASCFIETVKDLAYVVFYLHSKTIKNLQNLK